MEGLLLGDEGGLEGLDRVVVDRARGPVAGEERLAPGLREARLGKVEAAGAGAAAVVGQRAGDLSSKFL
jgi:hypothetical protein